MELTLQRGLWICDGQFIWHERTDYWMPVESMTTSAHVLDWIAQVAKKRTYADEEIGQLVRLIDDVVAPQATLCSGGAERGPLRDACKGARFQIRLKHELDRMRDENGSYTLAEYAQAVIRSQQGGPG